MQMLSLLPVVLLGVVTVWLVWPMIADPINRRLAMRATREAEALGDDLFRSIAKHSGPKRSLIRASRG